MMMLQDDGGDVRGFLKILQDRTPQRRAEEATRESEKRYRSLYDTIDAGFCVIEVAFDDGDIYRKVAKSELSERFEMEAKALDRRFEV